MPAKRRVAILIFEDVETLDFCGPYEVFTCVGRPDRDCPFDVFTVAEKASPVTARSGLSVNPAHTLLGCPRPDILVVPGGLGVRREMHNPGLIQWLRDQAGRAGLVLSVCTGSVLLGQAGLLDGLAATTHHRAMDLLARTAPRAVLKPGERYLDNGRIVVAAGISAGLDASLYVVGRLLGQDVARATAAHMEYDWRG